MNLHEARRSRPVLVSRIGSPVITPDLESVWPEVEARLRSMLRRRGVRHHDIDEVVQETAARVISTRVHYDDADDLFRWASVVGGRLAIDVHRRGARFSDEELPDRPDPVDVAMAAEHRVVLGAVRTRLPELSKRDQEMLLSSFHDEAARGRRESVRIAVARHRARNRLRLLLDGLAGGAILSWIRRNRLWSAPADAISYAAAPTAASLFITVSALTGVAADQSNAAAVLPKPAAQLVAVPSDSITPVEDPADAPAPSGRETPPQSAPRSPAPPLVEDPDVTIDEGGLGQTRAGTRDKQESDHFVCLTSPSMSGPETRCLDSPVTLPPTP